MKAFIFASLLVTICSCTSPEVRFSQQAENFNFTKEIIKGTVFEHMIYIKPSVKKSTLHIYLDGDGSPWINHRWVSNNPTPRNTLMLQLMRLDENFSVYIGRPCYFGLDQSPECTNKFWTSHRYSPTIINSMLAVIQSMTKRYQAKRLILIGHSGGGTLATLIAKQVPETIGIITLAANLDINAWVEYHGYSPLTGSLNPASQPPLPKNIFQLHLAGGKDDNIKLEHIESYAKKQYCAQVHVIEGYDHHCCWEEIWAAVLTSIETDDYASQNYDCELLTSNFCR